MALASGTPVAGSAPTYAPNQGAAGLKGASGNNYDGLAGGSYTKHADNPYTITSFGTRTSYRIEP